MTFPAIWDKPVQAPGTNRSNPNMAQSPIELPRLKSSPEALAELFQSGILPKQIPLTAPQLQPQTLNTLDDSFFRNLEQQATKKLNEQFFTNPDSILVKQSNLSKQQGLFGSPLGNERNTNPVFKNFGSSLADVQSDIANLKAKQQQDVSKFNIQNLIDTSKFNVGTGLDVDKFNEGQRFNIAELGLKGALDEARTQSDFAKDIFKSQVEERKGSQEQISKLLSDLVKAVGTETIDTETRNYLEGIFKNYVREEFGVS